MMILAEKATPVEEISSQKAEEELRALTSKSIPANTPNRLAEVAKLQKQVEVARAKVGVSRRGGGI
jgi:F0F1-type ATP synthase epsilon subunit